MVSTELNSPHTNELWVVLHGAFAIFEHQNHIEARIPNLGWECPYRAGDWLAETSIQPGETYRLSVPGGERTGSFNDKENLVVCGRSPARAGLSRLYATLVFPRPDEIHSFPQPLGNGCVGRDSSGLVMGSAVQKLVYKNVNSEQVTFGDDWWKPHSRNRNPSILSIVVDPESSDVPEGHEVRSFESVVSLVADLDLHWTRGQWRPTHDNAGTSDLPPYLIQDLYRRNEWMASVGASLRRLFDKQIDIEALTKDLLNAPRELEQARLGVDPPWCMPIIIIRGGGD
mgnify:CR=1 FL=1